MTASATRQRLHDCVEATMRRERLGRAPAMQHVAEAEGFRPGIVAASYWIIERERREASGADSARQLAMDVDA